MGIHQWADQWAYKWKPASGLTLGEKNNNSPLRRGDLRVKKEGEKGLKNFSNRTLQNVGAKLNLSPPAMRKQLTTPFSDFVELCQTHFLWPILGEIIGAWAHGGLGKANTSVRMIRKAKHESRGQSSLGLSRVTQMETCQWLDTGKIKKQGNTFR